MKTTNNAPAPRSHGYSPQETADVRTAAISNAVETQLRLSRKAPVKVDLHDCETVRRKTEEYAAACSSAGLVPNVEGLAAFLGVSRRWFYQFLTDHSDEPSAQYLDRCRTAWASIRIQLAERGVLSDTMVIFTTLNSSLGFTNRHELAIEPPENPLQTADPEEARRRIAAAVASMPDDE